MSIYSNLRQTRHWLPIVRTINFLKKCRFAKLILLGRWFNFSGILLSQYLGLYRVSVAKNNDNLIVIGIHTIWFRWDQWPLRVHIHHSTISVNQINELSHQRGSSLIWHHCLTRNYLPYFSYTDENVRCKPGKITRLCATFCKKLWRRKKMIKRRRLSKRRKLREKKRLPRNRRAVAREINDPAILHTGFLLHDLCADIVHINVWIYLQLKCEDSDTMMFYAGEWYCCHASR